MLHIDIDSQRCVKLCRGVRRRPDAALAEIVDEGDEFTGVQVVTFQVEDAEDVASVEVVEAGSEVRAFRDDARGVNLEAPAGRAMLSSVARSL